MSKKEIIKQVESYIKKEFSGESSGHDCWHIFRVWKMAKEIAKKELPAQSGGGDLFAIELGALLHDIGDWKFNDDPKAASKKAKPLLENLGVDEATIKHVCEIIDNVSFKGADHKNGIKTLEGKIVQDADRLEAIGAIGIARAFAYGGKKGRPIYDPKIKPHAYFSTSINHFYEKLLLLRDKLNTKTARKIAEPRHKFLETYLKQFFNEWEVEVTK